MLGLFKKKSNAKLIELAQICAEANIQRARLQFQLLSIDPLLSDMEVAVLWAAGAVVMRRAHSDVAKDAAPKPKSIPQAEDTWRMASNIACDLFDNECQSYIEVIAESDLKLSLSSELIRVNVDSTLDSMTPDRLNMASEIMVHLSANALKLANCTIAIVSSGLSSAQALEARKHAFGLVEASLDLNQFETEKAKDFIHRAFIQN